MGGLWQRYLTNSISRIYTKIDGAHWIHHNIEETGRTQDILPIIFANKDKVYFK